MGKSRTLVYQLGKIYKINKEYWYVIRQEDYKKPNGRFGQRVTFSLTYRPKVTIEREQQYRNDMT